MNRRDILKLFGVGAAVVPVVGGVPVSAAQSLIVKPPEIEIPPEPKIVPPFECPAPGAYECTLFMRERRTATVYRMECQAFMMESRMSQVDVTDYSGQFRSYIPGPVDVSFKATGEVRCVRMPGKV